MPEDVAAGSCVGPQAPASSAAVLEAYRSAGCCCGLGADWLHAWLRKDMHKSSACRLSSVRDRQWPETHGRFYSSARLYGAASIPQPPFCCFHHLLVELRHVPALTAKLHGGWLGSTDSNHRQFQRCSSDKRRSRHCASGRDLPHTSEADLFTGAAPCPGLVVQEKCTTILKLPAAIRHLWHPISEGLPEAFIGIQLRLYPRRTLISSDSQFSGTCVLQPARSHGGHHLALELYVAVRSARI